LLLPDEY